MNTNRLSKTLVIGIIILLIFASLPLVSGNGLYSIDREIRTSEEDTSPSPGIIYDNLRIWALGTSLVDILMILLGRSTYFLGVEVYNGNDIPITLNEHITLVATKENRVLDEFDVPSGTLPPDSTATVFFFAQQIWIDEDFTFGLFDLIVDINVPETETDFTVVFHGFVWIRIGAFIFNPGGELVE